MKKIVRADELKVGDVVEELRPWPSMVKTQTRFRVTSVKADGRHILVHGMPELTKVASGGLAYDNFTEFILFHRPWPEGETEESMSWKVVLATARCVRAEDPARFGGKLSVEIGNLREALDAYELGKPPAEDK